MALNRYMHPENPYRSKKPDFKDFALKYEEFRAHSTQDTAGKVHIDFTKPECLQALSYALLKNDFGLDVDMPLDRLIPTIPLRLNYVLWMKDIVGDKDAVRGIDIGCGASCVYPLIGCKFYGWKFLATEVDDKNYEYAMKNVQKNEMQDSIEVMKVQVKTSLNDVLSVVPGTYEFCMCNPPFYDNNLEAHNLTASRKPERPEPKSVSTASEHESVFEGGEVAYVKQMIEDSLILKDRIRVYSSMLGKKNSLGTLKYELQSKKINRFSCYEFCQGRTMRWGLAWTFDSSVEFPVSPFKAAKVKQKPPLVYTIPKELEKVTYSVDAVGREIEKILQEFKIPHTVVMSSEVVWSVSASAKVNTWSHQRRKRRQEAKEEKMKEKLPKVEGDAVIRREKGEECGDIDDKLGTGAQGADGGGCLVGDPSECKGCTKRATGSAKDGKISDTEGATQMEVDGAVTDQKVEQTEDARTVEDLAISKDQEQSDSPSKAGESEQMEQPAEEGKGLLFKCWISVRKEKPGIIIEMKWMQGESREAMHQVMQLFKNRIK